MPLSSFSPAHPGARVRTISRRLRPCITSGVIAPTCVSFACHISISCMTILLNSPHPRAWTRRTLSYTCEWTTVIGREEGSSFATRNTRTGTMRRICCGCSRAWIGRSAVAMLQGKESDGETRDRAGCSNGSATKSRATRSTANRGTRKDLVRVMQVYGMGPGYVGPCGLRAPWRDARMI